MVMRHLLSSSAAVALLTHAGFAVAQTAPQPTQDQTVPTVVVDDKTAAPAAPVYGSGGESGTTTLNREAVHTRAPGSGDVNSLLRIVPSIQFSNEAGNATREDLQDLRPETISISGGSVNENRFTIDGVGVNSYMYDSDAGAGDFTGAGVAAASAQTHWVDQSLVGGLVVRDSNISARYGDFTGGVVEILTRAPSSVFGMEAFYGLTSDGMAEYKVSDVARDALPGGVAPNTPEFEKERFGFSADLPVNARLRLLTAYNRTTATVTNFPGANYAVYGAYGQTSTKETWLLKGEYDLSDTLLFTGLLTYAPYEAEARQTNTAYNNRILSNAGGLVAQARLDGERGPAIWNLQLNYSGVDNDRQAPSGTFNISNSAPGMAGCSAASSCTIGAAGDFTQQQDVVTLSGQWEQPLGAGHLSAGFDFGHVEARRARSQDLISHLTTSASVNTVCTTGESLACRNGSYALTTQLRYGAFDARANIDSYALWGEYQFDLAGFDVRAGLRYDYESFLENHNISPRLSVSREVPGTGMTVTAGLNRYYNRSFVGYALREGAGVTRTFTRTPTIVGTERRWSDNWVLTNHTDSNRYSGLGLDTPYSDEATLAVSGVLPWVGGDYRVKGVLRDTRDMIASSPRTTEVYDRETGTTATRSVYHATNEGERSYRGLSLEYTRTIGSSQAVSFSADFSHTDASNLEYFDVPDNIELSGRMVYYQGQVVDLLQATADNQLLDYASPFILNADWGASWFGGRVTTNVNARYREGYKVVADTGVNINVSGTNYDVFDKVEVSGSVEANLFVEAEVVRSAYGTMTVEARVNNVFNAVLNDDYVSSTQPYQLGRNAWFGVKYKY